MTNKMTVPVFFSTNDQYVPYLYVTITSLIQHANSHDNYELYILNEGLTKEHQIALQELSTSNITIHLISMGKRVEYLKTENNTLRGEYETLTIYYRLFIPEMFPEYQKAIYLDADVCVMADVAKLFEVDLGENLLGAVPDTFGRQWSETIDYIENIVGVTADHYFNSGVLLMNLAQLRQEHFYDHFIHLLTTYHLDVLAADQDYINALCQGQIQQLSSTWNYLPSPDSKTAVAQPMIVHYNFFNKPWLHENVPFADNFWQVAKNTPFYQQLQRELAADSPTRRQHEINAVHGLIHHASELVENGQGFARLFSSGKESALCLNQNV